MDKSAKYIRLAACVLGLLTLVGASNSAFAYTENTLRAFCQERKCADGSHPHDLAMDQSGNL